MMQFKGFKPEAMERIAGTLGYKGNMNGFEDYLNQNPDKKNAMNMYQNKAIQMMRGGMVRNFNEGGVPGHLHPHTDPIDPQDATNEFTNSRDVQTGATATQLTNNSSLEAPIPERKTEFDFGGFSETPFNQDDTLKMLKHIDGLTPFNEADAAKYDFNKDGVVNQADVDAGNIRISSGGKFEGEVQGRSILDITAGNVEDPRLARGTAVEAVGTNVQDNQIIDETTGQVTGDITSGTATADTATATAADTTAANTVVDPRNTAGDVDKVLDDTKAAEGTVSDEAKIEAATSDESSVSKLDAATGEGILMDDPKKRVLEDGELVAGSTVDPEKAAEFTEKIQAATATPTEKATVRGQLEDLMGDFEGGATPAWAAGAMRGAMGAMAARGLGASSLAGQALVQAAMESALPIASADASMFASFESQNLSNRQQRAMLGAQQRAQFMGQKFDQEFQSRVMNASKVSDIANMNFTAEQQVALENSRIANTMNLANLSNEQALVMAEAASLSQLDMASLSNRQQAAVQNAQNVMQMDLTNLSNRQATTMFKSQQKIQALFTDSAADNAAAQFNASSKNQTDQFFANLKTQTSQFNTSQANAQNQYNAGQINAQDNFNSEMMNQREQFNANNKLVVEQSNAVWRREVATASTASINRTNELNASAMLDISNTAYNNTWQYYADTMENAYTATNNERDRMTQLAVAKLQVDASFDIAKWQADASSSAAVGQAIVAIATTDFNGTTALESAWNWITGSS